MQFIKTEEPAKIECNGCQRLISVGQNAAIVLLCLRIMTILRKLLWFVDCFTKGNPNCRKTVESYT